MCGGRYIKMHKKNHEKSKKHQEYLLGKKQESNCECGGRYTEGHKTHHEKSKMHREYLLGQKYEITCECGGRYRGSDKPQNENKKANAIARFLAATSSETLLERFNHEKSKMHQDYEKKNKKEISVAEYFARE